MSKRAIATRLTSLLKPLGFTRHGSVWNRCAGDFVEVIDLQTSKVGGSITVNAGVLDPEVNRALWCDDLSAAVKVTACTVSVRVGDLIDGRDVWWPLHSNETPDKIAEATIAYVLPFIHRLSSRGAMVQWLKDTRVVETRSPPPIVSLAILQHYLGQPSEARAMLMDLREKTSDAWRARISDVADRLGYSLN